MYHNMLLVLAALRISCRIDARYAYKQPTESPSSVPQIRSSMVGSVVIIG